MCAELNYMSIPGVPKTTNRDRSRLFRVFDPEVIIKTSLEYFNLTIEQLQDTSRKRTLVLPRQIIMYFLTEYTDLTYLEIGNIFKKDHTTVIYSKDTVKDLISTDDSVKEKVEELKKKIANNH
jgi:chromosomal replication initiator protein